MIAKLSSSKNDTFSVIFSQSPVFFVFDTFFLIGAENPSDTLSDPEQHFSEAEQFEK